MDQEQADDRNGLPMLAEFIKWILNHPVDKQHDLFRIIGRLS
jgi:hypothetical protein